MYIAAEACSHAGTGSFCCLFESVGTGLACANRLQDTPRRKDNIKYHNEGTESKNVNKIQLAEYRV